MWSCSFWTQPQKVVGYHRETHHFSEEKSTKEATAPQHTRFILPPIHPTKSSLRCVGGIFLFREAVPWILHKPSERDTVPWPHTFCERAGQRRCTNRGRNFVRSKRWPPYMSRTTSTYFCVLTIRKHLLMKRFERSGRGQEPSRGHKFSILENVVLHRDFTSAMRLHFRSDLVGACLPQTLLGTSTANWNLTNPTCASYYTHVIILYINSFSISKLNLIFAVR